MLNGSFQHIYIDMCTLFFWIICVLDFIAVSTGSPTKGKYLQGEILQTIEIIGLCGCSRECRAVTNCKSYNYDRNELKCNLMTVDSSTGTLVDDESSYYEDRSSLQPVLQDPCSSTSCPTYTKCVSTRRGTAFCVPIECNETPPTISNAALSINKNHFLIGSKLTYACSTGFSMDGLPDLTCKANKAWSPKAFTCAGCGTLPTVSNASPTAGGSATGSVRTYTCNTGYTQTGTISTTCQPSLQWSTPSESCTIVNCGTPATLNGANIDSGETTYGSSRTYTCSTGYSSNNQNGGTTCQSNGDWTSPLLVCTQLVCGTLPTVSNGSPGGGGSAVGDTRVYTCSAGYTQSGSITVSCQSDPVQWSSPTGQCNIVNCGNPSSLNGGSITSGETTYGSSRTYSCLTGYNSNGQSGIVTCQSSGSWSSPALVCTIKDCGNPSSLNGGSITSGGTTYGISRIYSCLMGYNSNGQGGTVTCQSSGSWSSPALVCTIKDCGNPSSLNGGSITSGGTTYGISRTYSCLTGYNSNGQSGVVNCQSSGSWSSPALVCTIKDCGGAPSISNAGGSGATTYGQTWTYSCNTGYVASGSPASISCLSTGSWQSTTYTCAAAGCTTPLVVFGAVITGTGTSTGSTRTVTCDTAYTQTGGSGPGTSTCQANGQWSNSGVTCAACTSLSSTFTLRSNKWFNPPVSFTPSISGGSVNAESCQLACRDRSDFPCVAAYYRKNPSGYCVVRPQRVHDQPHYPTYYTDNSNYDEYIRNCN